MCMFGSRFERLKFIHFALSPAISLPMPIHQVDEAGKKWKECGRAKNSNDNPEINGYQDVDVADDDEDHTNNDGDREASAVKG